MTLLGVSVGLGHRLRNFLKYKKGITGLWTVISITTHPQILVSSVWISHSRRIAVAGPTGFQIAELATYLTGIVSAGGLAPTPHANR